MRKTELREAPPRIESELGTTIPREMPVQPLEKRPALSEDRDLEQEEEFESEAPEREAS